VKRGGGGGKKIREKSVQVASGEKAVKEKMGVFIKPGSNPLDETKRRVAQGESLKKWMDMRREYSCMGNRARSKRTGHEEVKKWELM